MDHNTNNWVFVIDTEDYAGNFERDMTAYITGHVGDCQVGEDMVPFYKEETGDTNCEKFTNLLEYRPDEHGCNRPCSIYPTPGWFNHGMGGHFKDGEEAKALNDYVEQCTRVYGKEYMANPLAAKKALDEGKQYANWTYAAVEREIKRLTAEVEKARKLKKVAKYPAYLSVAIFFNEKPSKTLIKLMKERAYTFCKANKVLNARLGFKYHPEKLTITGFRLVKECKSTVEETV